MFSSSTPQQQQGGGLFGSSATQQGGGLFGSSGTPQQGGGLFGSSSTPQQSGGLFGGSSNTAQSGGLFGGGSNNTQSGGLFGGGNNAQSGGLFGGSNNNAQGGTQGGSLFGGSSNAQPGGLFGGSNNAQGGGLFGSSASPQPGGLFGASNNAQSGGLFGSSNNMQQPQSGGIFGQQQQQQQQQQQPPQQLPTAAPWWYRELMSVQAAYKAGQGSRFQTMLYEVLGIAPDLMVHSGAVALAHVDNIKTQRKRLVLQANPWIDEREWQRAEDKNPDPINWMPAPVIGVDALYERVEQQAAHVRAQLEMLSQPPSKAVQRPQVGSGANQGQQQEADGGGGLQLSTIRELDESKESSGPSEGERNQLWFKLEVGEPQEQIEQCRHEHIRLKHRLIKALGRLERLQCASMRGGRAKPEIDFDQRLGRLESALNDPRGCRAQLTSIVTQMELEDYQDSKLSLRGDLRPSGGAFATEQDQVAIFNFLDLQRQGIDSLMQIVKRDMRDLEIIKRRIAES